MATPPPKTPAGVNRALTPEEEAAKPYAASDTAEILKTAIYFANHPQGELVSRMAMQLRKADAEINAANSRAFQAELKQEKSEKAQRALEESVVDLRRRLAATEASAAPKASEDLI